MTGAAQGNGVLIVEDDEAIRETLSELLVGEGYPVAMVGNGAEALLYLLSHSRPCVIVLDLMMPVMDGEEFRRKQLAHPHISDIPVIVMSAADSARRTASAMRAQGFVPKPPPIESLLETIRLHC